MIFFAGIEYLYRRDGHWLVSDKIGLHEAGMQNQVKFTFSEKAKKIDKIFTKYKFDSM